MRHFQLLGGHHVESDGRKYSKGDVIGSHDDLEKLFQNKFKEVNVVVQPDKTLKVALPAPTKIEAPKNPPSAKPVENGTKKTGKIKGDKKKGVGPKTDAAKDARGTDVTSKYPSAEEEGLTVFQRDDKFWIFEGDDLEPVNQKQGGLPDFEVESFVKSFLED